MLRTCFLEFLTSIVLLVSLVSQPSFASSSYRDLRYQGVVPQTEWYTCGPAAVATLLSQFFGIPATESEILELIFSLEIEDEHSAQLDGISALALRQALELRGVPTLGYRLSSDALVDYLRRGGLPVIAHVTLPRHHFVVVIGVVGRYLVLADPSWGRRIIPIDDLDTKKGYSGVTLVPLPEPENAVSVSARQQERLNDVRGRLVQLSNLGGRLR